MSIRTDWYTAPFWRAVPDERRAVVEAAVPEGCQLSLTHGGKLFRAVLLRDGEVLDRAEAPRVERAVERVLSRLAAL